MDKEIEKRYGTCKDISICDVFPDNTRDDQKDFIKQTHLHNVELYFSEDSKKISLTSYFNVNSEVDKNGLLKVNQTEFILDENKKITEIKQLYIDRKEQKPPITISDEEEINKEIKNIFGNKNNTAIQNIIYELDDEQKKLITNGNLELLNSRGTASFIYNCPCSSCLQSFCNGLC